MVIDTSALLAILLGEAERDDFASAIAGAGVRLLCSVNAFEAAIVLQARKGEAGVRELDLLLHAASIDVVPLANEHLGLARAAYARFGKGRHPAGLNLGDCCAYALARHSGEALLYKGDDFARTDIPAAIATGPGGGRRPG